MLFRPIREPKLVGRSLELYFRECYPPVFRFLNSPDFPRASHFCRSNHMQFSNSISGTVFHITSVVLLLNQPHRSERLIGPRIYNVSVLASRPLVAYWHSLLGVDRKMCVESRETLSRDLPRYASHCLLW